MKLWSALPPELGIEILAARTHFLPLLSNDNANH